MVTKYNNIPHKSGVGLIRGYIIKNIYIYNKKDILLLQYDSNIKVALST